MTLTTQTQGPPRDSRGHMLPPEREAYLAWIDCTRAETDVLRKRGAPASDYAALDRRHTVEWRTTLSRLATTPPPAAARTVTPPPTTGEANAAATVAAPLRAAAKAGRADGLAYAQEVMELCEQLDMTAKETSAALRGRHRDSLRRKVASRTVFGLGSGQRAHDDN